MDNVFGLVANRPFTFPHCGLMHVLELKAKSRSNNHVYLSMGTREQDKMEFFAVLDYHFVCKNTRTIVQVPTIFCMQLVMSNSDLLSDGNVYFGSHGSLTHIK